MRRPAVLAVLLGIALFAVIYGKYRLDNLIKEGKLDSLPSAGKDQQNTIDLGVQQDDPKSVLQEAPPHSTGSTHQDVVVALVEARQSFRSKEAVSSEAAADPHVTPNSIVKSAEKLGQLITLEQSHPEYKPEFQAFYLECSKDSLVITVTRVQCLEKYVKSKQLSEADEKQLLSETDQLVKKLYLDIR